MKIDNESKKKGTDSELPTVDFHYSWHNEIRKFRLYFDKKAKKYISKRIVEKNLGNVNVVGINVSLLKD